MSDQIDYAPIIADLERRRAELDQTIATLKRLAGMAADDTSGGHTNGGGLPAIGGGLRDDAFFGMTAPEAVKAYLAWAKRPQGAAKIADELVAHGFTTASDTPANVIRTALRRLREASEVAQVKKDWGLAIWYPGLKRKPKPDDTGEGDDDDGTAANATAGTDAA